MAEQTRIVGGAPDGSETKIKAQMENEDLAMHIDSKPEENNEAKIFVETYLKGASGAAETIEIQVRLS